MNIYTQTHKHIHTHIYVYIHTNYHHHPHIHTFLSQTHFPEINISVLIQTYYHFINTPNSTIINKQTHSPTTNTPPPNLHNQHPINIFYLMRMKLSNHRARNFLLPISQFPLIQISHQPRSQNNNNEMRAIYKYCSGDGLIKSPRTIYNQIYYK
jgi:hypothetical protein